MLNNSRNTNEIEETIISENVIEKLTQTYIFPTENIWNTFKALPMMKVHACTVRNSLAQVKLSLELSKDETLALWEKTWSQKEVRQEENQQIPGPSFFR